MLDPAFQSVVDEWFPEDASAPPAEAEPESADAEPYSWEGEADDSTFEQQQEWLAEQEQPQPFETFAELDAAFEQASSEEQAQFLDALSDEQKAEILAAYNAVDAWVMPRLEAIRAKTQAEAAQAGYAHETEARAQQYGDDRVNAILSSCHLPLLIANE